MAKKSAVEEKLAELERMRSKGTISEEEYQSGRQAALANAGAAAPAGGSKGGGIFKFGLLGCGGILGAIVLLIVIVAVVASGSGSSETSGTSGGSSSGSSSGDVRVALAAGSSGVIAPQGNGEKKTKVTILAVNDNVKSTNSFEKPGEGNKWIGFQVEVENVGTKEVTSLDWKLRDSANGEHDRDIVVGAGQMLELVFNLTPGGKVQGWVYFEVPAGVTAKWLRADPNPFLKNDLYFDAP